MGELFRIKVYRNNLIILGTLWAFSSFAFFLIPYYIAFIDINIYLISMCTAIAEIISVIICFLIPHGSDLRKMLAIFCGLTAVGTLGVMLFQWLYEGDSAFPQASCYLILYVGIVTAFDLVYLIVNDLFPAIFLATSYGVCNVAGRFISIFAPLVAVIPAPVPMLVLLIFSGVCTVLPLCLVKIDQKQK